MKIGVGISVKIRIQPRIEEGSIIRRKKRRAINMKLDKSVNEESPFEKYFHKHLQNV